jgi:2-polyprenyl-6-methoxyphenol hydroxylase-like FAD-dependent oxidoreductase
VHIAVVGGSIAGSALAVLLGRAGHNVTVYERSSGELKGRGAGLSMPSQLMQLMTDRDLLDVGTESVRPRDRVWCVADGRSPTGRTIATQRMVNQFIRYGQLYQNLARHYPGRRR